MPCAGSGGIGGERVRGTTMPDLFSDDLSNLKLQDLEDFLGLHLEERQRPIEGPQLDFKVDLPNDLGDSVAALANTYGGLLFIGVRSEKKKHNIPVAIVGVDLKGGDSKARITDRVLSTVHPRPDFDVKPVPVGSSKSVIVIRVREGNYPPYQYTQGSTVRIPVRIQDTNRQATVREIEDLLSKRTSFAKPMSERVSEYQLYIPGEDAILHSAGLTLNSPNFQWINISPKKGLGPEN